MSNQKKKFQFKGKQILLLGLVALVITAGYYRWTVEQEQFMTAVPTTGDTLPVNADNTESIDGESQENTGGSSEEISKLKQDRDSARSLSVEEWNKIAKSSEASAEAKRDAEKKVSSATDNAEKERKIETLVIAKGFEDCIAYVDDSGVSVTVKGGEIDGSKVAQIKDIIVSETGASVKNIKINAI